MLHPGAGNEAGLGGGRKRSAEQSGVGIGLG